MMNKQTFKELIADSAFKELFISEMGWNNPQGSIRLPDISIDETNYTFEQIAGRSGFQVLSCKVDSIPTSSTCKKIDTQLRKQANDYICIYYIPNTEHHLWVVPVKKVEKRDLVLIEYDSAAKAEFLYSKMADLTFEYDEITTIMDVKDKVQADFIINSEKITKDFYTGFRKEHTNFAKFISGIDDEITDLKKNRNKQWYTSVMLNRLMFCYFIQKKGFLDRNVNYLREKLNWVQEEKGADRFYGSFYQGFLLSLFHDGLNSPRHEEGFVQKYGRIPYLNGGMFSIHELEEQYPALDIADEAFESLFDFFDQWHWHLDDRLTASGKDINPDVLGYIFEQYINDRAQMGAYYTKEDITEYIGRNTILPFLMDATKKTDDTPFKTNGAIWQFLKDSGDTYIYDAVKKGKGLEIPEEIAVGIDTSKPNLLERRSHWNEKTPEPFALPTEIWRETIERLQRYANIKAKIENGEITEINDFITYNLDIRQFVQDFLTQTDDHLFVKHFYAQLRKVTILDPTCGSGAFLFAALNILEPLYEVCIDRMQSWNAGNPLLFKVELEELYGKYRSNIRYFIYKNIILRNLYGVDIMVEATEIAKLRLFLKMVAVVDVNPREENLGLDPLPDIDFNIRCGNTLVGYATAQDLENDLNYGDMFAKQEFKDKVTAEMDVVSSAYDTFRKVQLEQDEDLEIFKKAKKELKKRLAKLNELLNKKLHTATARSMDYDEWKKSHQPFHWLAEYYDIINGNKGFDVIIGNPPYVEYNKKVQGIAVSDIYKLHGYKTIDCGNLYAYCIERTKFILRSDGKSGMIIPHSSICTDRMEPLLSILSNRGGWFSTYDTRPAHLFEGVDQRLLIYILGGNNIYTTKYNRWSTDTRHLLFSCLSFNISYISSNIATMPKIGSSILYSIVDKLVKKKVPTVITKETVLYYHNAPRYFIRFSDTPPYFYNDKDGESISSHIKTINVPIEKESLYSAIYNSTLFYIWFILVSNCRDLTIRDIKAFPNTKGYFNSLLIQKLYDDYNSKSKRKTTFYKATGQVIYDEFYPKLSKPIIDEIDEELAKHYGFTDEELDFIINYDIKYRMGDELGEDNDSAAQPQKPQPARQRQKSVEQKAEPNEDTLTLYVRSETIDRIKSGEKTTFKRYLDDEGFAKQVLVTENGKIKISGSNCPYTAKNITSVKLVCDKESIVKKVTNITFRSGINQQGKTVWKIIFHF